MDQQHRHPADHLAGESVSQLDRQRVQVILVPLLRGAGQRCTVPLVPRLKE